MAGDPPADLAFVDPVDGDDGSEVESAAADEAAPVAPLGVAVVGVDGVDPATVSVVSPGQMLLADLLFDGLTAHDQVTGEVIGVLAERWEVSANGLVWEFGLVEGVTFSDGTPLTAHDVKRSIERVVAVDATAVPAARLDVVLGFEAMAAGSAEALSGLLVVDDATLQVLLTEPYSPLPVLLTSPVYGVVPEGEVDGTVTSGPYDAVAVGDRWELTARAGAAVEAPLERLDVVVFDSRDAAMGAFATGEVDVAPAVDPGDDGAGAELVEVPMHVIVAFGMNTAVAPFDSVEFRRAVAAAIDREALVAELWPGAAVAVDRLVPAGAGCADAACGHDLEAAAAHLFAAVPFGAEVPEVVLDVAVDDAGREARLAQAVAGQLEAVGIPVTVREHTVQEFVGVAALGELGLFRSGWVALFPSPDSYLSAFLSDGSDNLTSYGDPAVDELLAAARATTDADGQAEAYGAVEQALSEAAPVVPIAQLQLRLRVNERVSGLVFRSDGTLVLDGVELGPPA